MFDAFAAIDWSGAKGARHKGIALAIALPGLGAPELVPPPNPRGWSRSEVGDWLRAFPGRLLAGFDFSFAPPFADRGAYLPGVDAPEQAPEFWEWLEGHCADPDLGVGDFIAGVGRAHFWLGAADGAKVDFMRFRQCEAAFNANGGGKASTVFDCVGAAQVSKASFAGMRLLHRLRGDFAVWPFDTPDERSVIVEIYTRAMLRHAGLRGLKLRSRGALDAALLAFGSAGVGEGPALSDHETDVLISAAALRHLAGDARWWNPPALLPSIARTEGWTFGIE